MLDKIKALFETEDGKLIYEAAYGIVKKYDMLPMISEGVLVGFSGGPDSVMLLCFLLELRRREALDFKITCAHVNHGIREIEAERDEEFCISICKAFDTELIVEKHSVPALAQANGEGIEEAARNLRYSIFADIIRGRNNISAIAVAHNMNDNAETVLFNILRGSGANGAGGIRPVRDNIIRPLISVLKNDILAAKIFFSDFFISDTFFHIFKFGEFFLKLVPIF